jgi:hypothetical protein
VCGPSRRQFARHGSGPAVLRNGGVVMRRPGAAIGTPTRARRRPSANEGPSCITGRASTEGFLVIELLTSPTRNCTKPSIMVEEVGSPYSVHLVNIVSGEQRSPEFLAISPNNKTALYNRPLPLPCTYDAFSDRCMKLSMILLW